MNSLLLAKAQSALSQVEPMTAQEWAPAVSIARQLRWCVAFASDQPREERPGPFSMGLIATREFAMYGDRPELASLISEVQREVEHALASSSATRGGVTSALFVGFSPAVLEMTAHDPSSPCIPPTAPFFTDAEVARLIQGQPVREPLPFDAADDGAIRRFYEALVQQIEREHGLRARVEWHHYGSGYASFIDAWFYSVDGCGSLPPFQTDGERHVGLVVLLSRLSRFFVLGQDERAWSANGGSGGLPNFSAVDDLTHPALLPLVAPATGLLTAGGLQRLTRSELAAFLPATVSVPTILTDEPFRQFDALFFWED